MKCPVDPMPALFTRTSRPPNWVRAASSMAMRPTGSTTSATTGSSVPADAAVVDLAGRFLTPGFVDLHVHGGDGADFMDLSAEAFRTVRRCHARHGTTSLTPTSTVATVADSLRFLDLCAETVGETDG